jgi:hypothetical protein
MCRTRMKSSSSSSTSSTRVSGAAWTLLTSPLPSICHGELDGARTETANSSDRRASSKQGSPREA